MKRILPVLFAIIIVLSAMFSAISCGNKSNAVGETSSALTEEEKDTVSGDPTDGPEDKETAKSDPEETEAATVPATEPPATEPLATEPPATEAPATETSEPEKTSEPNTLSDEEIYAIYLNAALKTLALDGLHMKSTITQDLTMRFDGSLQTTHDASKVVDEYKMVGRQSGNLRFEMHETNMSDPDSNVDVYSDEDNYYIQTNGTGYTKYSKSDPAVETLKSLLSKDDFSMEILPQKAFTNVSVKTEKGATEISVKPDPGTVQDVYDQVVENYQSYFTQIGASDLKTSIISAEYLFVVSEEGYIIKASNSIKMLMKMVIYSYNTTSYVTGSSDTEYIDPGKPVVIEYPNL